MFSYRARQSKGPRRGPFFDDSAAHEFVIISASWLLASQLSTRVLREPAPSCCCYKKSRIRRKKAGPKRARL